MSFLGLIKDSFSLLLSNNENKQEDKPANGTIASIEDTKAKSKKEQNSTDTIIPIFFDFGNRKALRDVILSAASKQEETRRPTSDRIDFVNEVFDGGRLADVIESVGGVDAITQGSKLNDPTFAPSIERIRNTVIKTKEPPLPDPVHISDDDFDFVDPTASETLLRTVRLGPDGRYSKIEEAWTGRPLLLSEKPRILAIMAKDIHQGFPRKSVLFIKKFNSDRGTLESVSILRKKIFEETAFKEIAKFTTQDLVIKDEYLEIVNSLPYQNKDVMVYEDSSIERTNVYMYRIHVIWRPSSEEEARESRRPVIDSIIGKGSS